MKLFTLLKRSIPALCLGLATMQSAEAAPPHRLDKLPDSEFWLIRPLKKRGSSKDIVRFLKLSNRGRKGEIFAQKIPRLPQPVYKGVTYLSDYGKPGFGTLSDVAIPIELLDESGVSRNAAEVRAGIPLPQGGIFSLENLRLENHQGTQVPAQYSVLSKWPDGSLRFVLATFSAGIKANEKQVWRMRAGTKVRHTKQNRINLIETADTITIKNKTFSAVIDKKRFNLIKSSTLNGKPAGNFSPDGLVVVDAFGKKYASTVTPPDEITVEEKSGERITLRISGILGAPKKTGNPRYTVRLYFRSTTPTVMAQITVINADFEYEYFDMNEVYVDFKPPFDVDTLVLGRDKASNIGRGTFIRQYTDRVIGPGKGMKLINGQVLDWVAIFGKAPKGQERFSAGFADIAKRWPKGVSVANKHARFELLPPLPDKNFGKDLPLQLVANFCEGKYRHFIGVAFTEKIFLDFSGGSFPVAAAEASCPIIPVIPASWYEKCGVFPGAGVEIPGFNERLNEMLANVKKSQCRDRESGYMNLGDWFGERSVNWGNNEYDTGYAYFLQFVRTGNRDFYRLGKEAASHQANTDTVHAWPNPRFVGGDHYHGIGHIGSADYVPAYYSPSGSSPNGRANNGHTWVGGLLAAWQLSGDAVAYDAALKIGEQLRFQSTAQRVMAGATRVTAWQLVADCVMYFNNPIPEYLTAASNIFEIQFREQNFAQAGIWAKKKARIPGSVPGQTIFMLGVAGQSMLEYHRATGDKRAEKSVVAIARWVEKAFLKDEHGFYYDEAWDHSIHNNLVVSNMGSYVGATVMYAALLTNDVKLKECSDSLMRMMLYRGFGVKKDMNMALLFTGHWFAFRKEWERRNPDDKFKFDRESFRQMIIARKSRNFRARSREKVRFMVTLKCDTTTVNFERLGVGKFVPGEITITDNSGKVVAKQQFSDARAKFVRVPLKGKKGESYTVSVVDQDGSFWSITPSKDYAAYLHLDKLTLLRRPDTRRFYFYVPKGTKEFKVNFYSRQSGAVSVALKDAAGKPVVEFQETNLSADTADLNVADLSKLIITRTVKNADPSKDAVWSADITMSIDGGISFTGIPNVVSIVPEALPKL